MHQPTVTLKMGPSFLAFDEKGEVLETTETSDSAPNLPDWTRAGIADQRGSGGEEGFRLITEALQCAERVAKLSGHEIERAPVEGEEARA